MSSRFRIGDLTLDTGRRVLFRDSQPIALGPLTYRLLLTLVEAAPNVVSHDELVQSIWDGRAVSPETISQRIKLLRDALADDPASPRYVEGVRGQGYRLLPAVEVLPNESPLRNRGRWIGRIGIAVALLIAATVVGWIMLKPPQATREASIAVLPFADLSEQHDQQYLADGVAEEILNLLSKATSLRVVARTSSFSFRDKNADMKTIAEALRVTHVLEGSVRKSGERIRVTVRLVDASDGSRVWSQSYDDSLGDILALQTTVARSVAAKLETNLHGVAEAASARVNPAAYELYLQGQQKIRQWSYVEAASFFEQAIAIDSQFIPAYHGLGLAYVMQVVTLHAAVAANREKLRDVLSRGLRLAPDDPGLLALSGQLARYDGQMKLAEERFAAAMRSDPANGVVRSLYPMFKLDRSEPQEALRLSRRSLEIDPFNPITYVVVWASHLDLGHEKEAMAAAAHYRELSAPRDTTGDAMTANTKLLLAGDLPATIGNIRKGAARIAAANVEGTTALLPLFYYVIGDLRTADALMAAARETPWNGWWINHAEIYRCIAHGDVDEARRLAVASLAKQQVWGGGDTDMIVLRFAIDGMIAAGEARRAVEFIETMAPEYARYKTHSDIDSADLSPAPIAVKSAYTSYPALYFPDHVRALRAAGDAVGANTMLDHLDAVLALRRKRGLFVEERHAAEALALRGRTEEALDALEKAERDRTIYRWWQPEVLHNEIFAALRTHPRFVALIARIQADLGRQREELSRIDALADSTARRSTP
jgi:TolB-like protein/DNA-binding winged helix-turn-helix (wHTH) protein/Flp pilus assembly protein TadD